MLAVLGVEFERPEWLSMRTWNVILKAGMYDLAAWWVAKILAKHFTRAGASEYGYRARTVAYNARKLRKFGHQNPLVYGDADLRDRLLSGAGVRISSTARGATITLKRAGGLRSRDIDRELTAVSDGDQAAMADHLAEFMAAKLNGWPGVRRERIA